jgi:hypothetical protein
LRILAESAKRLESWEINSSYFKKAVHLLTQRYEIQVGQIYWQRAVRSDEILMENSAN